MNEGGDSVFQNWRSAGRNMNSWLMVGFLKFVGVRLGGVEGEKTTQVNITNKFRPLDQIK
jgi:hypothetical protein